MMRMTKTEIGNLALVKLGVATEMTDMDTDVTPQAEALARIYEQARRIVLRRYDWQFARTIADLVLIEEDPNDGLEWGFSYEYPESAAAVRRLLNGLRA